MTKSKGGYSMKRFAMLVLLFVGVLVVFASEVRADPSLTVTSTDELYVAPGAQFDVVVSLADAVDIVGFQLELLYDSDQFTYVDVEESASLGGSITVNSSVVGVLKLNYVNISTKLNGAVDLFTLTFTASESLADGAQAVIEASATYNNEFIALDALNNLAKISDAFFDFKDVTKGLYGDVNLDGVVSIIDAGLIQLEIADLVTFTSVQVKLADADQDGMISVTDVALIQLYIAGLIPELPPLA